MGVRTRLVPNRTFRLNEQETLRLGGFKRCRHIRSPKACGIALEVRFRRLQPKPRLRVYFRFTRHMRLRFDDARV